MGRWEAETYLSSSHARNQQHYYLNDDLSAWCSEVTLLGNRIYSLGCIPSSCCRHCNPEGQAEISIQLVTFFMSHRRHMQRKELPLQGCKFQSIGYLLHTSVLNKRKGAFCHQSLFPMSFQYRVREWQYSTAHQVYAPIYPWVTCSSASNVKGDTVLEQSRSVLHKQDLTKDSAHFCLTSTNFRG